MVDLVGHFLLFMVVAIGFLMVPLLIGKLVRPKLPNPEKDAIYECGEPTIGTSYVQFDLRFYVVALLFIIFDVEVAFFFPWATIYGNVTQLADQNLSRPSRMLVSEKLIGKKHAYPGEGIVWKTDEKSKKTPNQVQTIRAGSLADAAGLQAGDVVSSIKIGETGFAETESIPGKIDTIPVGSNAVLSIQRGGKDLFVLLSYYDPVLAPVPAFLSGISKEDANQLQAEEIEKLTEQGLTDEAREVKEASPEEFASIFLTQTANKSQEDASTAAATVAYSLAIFGFFDILVFFGVLLVGFAYVWKRGDLDWVRAVAEKAKQAAVRPRTPSPLEPPPSEKEPVGV